VPSGLIRTWLLSKGYTEVYKNFKPNTTTEYISVFDYAGPTVFKNIAEPGIQIYVRGKDYDTTYKKVCDIRNLMENDAIYGDIATPATDIASLGKNGDFWEFTINFYLIKDI